MIQATTHEAQARPETRPSAEEEPDLVIGELEQEIPDRAGAAASTCIGWYCV
ncbi:hypothetical protein QQY24_02295 [Streptomyces sp. TG1A-8]|uniref:hypothetical protein n=1 Tax=Streptomyces sp. TG1A-8 TaxID=3051385 RepID=UPI00265C70AC|nr:hypothetical protein [Streptomyces sp. TG1A-8]MDO0924296.1 hypothetical protein [Streptomyces sp. TG1A-8]